MKVLVVGDVVGKPGRSAIRNLCPEIKAQENIDFIVVNGENIAGGSGFTAKTLADIFAGDVDVVTSGDHIWRKREFQDIIDNYDNVVRPANYPDGTPGRGAVVVPTKDGKHNIGVINLVGRVFMNPIDCPFRSVREEIDKIKQDTNIILVDFHAEATSEKVAMGWYLNGEASLVFGTHTHVATADERILDKGTAYITDVGMTGPMDSVIGRNVDAVLHRFITLMPTKFEVPETNVRLNGVIVEIDEETGKAISIERISKLSV